MIFYCSLKVNFLIRNEVKRWVFEIRGRFLKDGKR